MHVVFRVEGGPEIGMGHSSRCAVLAGQLSGRGAGVTFVATQASCDAIRVRLPDGVHYDFRPLPAGLAETADAQACAAILTSLPFRPDWLVVDHYGLGADWENAQRPFAGRLMVIDDLARRHACNLLLDQNYFANPGQRYHNQLEHSCRTLFGPGFALLRPGIALSRREDVRTDVPRRVFVCFGGADNHNSTQMALDAMAMLPDLAMQADIVIASTHPKRRALEKFCAGFPAWRLFTDHPAPEQLMAQADIGIGAGGVMTWERCAVGLPSIVVTIADNQKEVAGAMAEAGMILYGGHYDMTDAANLKELLEALWHDAHTRNVMAAEGMALVDGKGAARVAAIMCE